MAKEKNSTQKYFWLPISRLWNLNEVFTTESISPFSFYEKREFGNPVSRNEEMIENPNHLVLFSEAVESTSLLKISEELLDKNLLTEIELDKKSSLKSFQYPKTIYLRKNFFSVYFSSEAKKQEFINNAFMLLEVKAVNKYKSDFYVLDEKLKKATLQATLFSEKREKEVFFDKAFNQIKGLIYGYFIGSVGTFNEKEQSLINNITELKNTIAGTHTNIVLSEAYQGFWLINVRKQLKDCQKSYFENFGKQSDIFDILQMRLEEIDKLNKMRCDELSKQKTPAYKEAYQDLSDKLEKVKQNIYRYEVTHGISILKEELEAIKQQEKQNGELNGKKRSFFKKGSFEYDRKNELKQEILKFEGNFEYKNLKTEVFQLENELKNFQFGFTQFDSSISDQFSRISDQLYYIIKKTTSYFQEKNNNSDKYPDLSFKFSLLKLTEFYSEKKADYTDFSIDFPIELSAKLELPELELLKITINAVLTKTQGRLGNFSEQNILAIIKDIGGYLPEESPYKQNLREYYSYRIGKSDKLKFPENSVMANIIVFLMKLNGYDQIRKMLNARKISNQWIAFLLYGAYYGFSNLPKTFTNIVFDSDKEDLYKHIDDYLFISIKK